MRTQCESECARERAMLQAPYAFPRDCGLELRMFGSIPAPLALCPWMPPTLRPDGGRLPRTPNALLTADD
jgi:hypothetical protein